MADKTETGEGETMETGQGSIQAGVLVADEPDATIFGIARSSDWTHLVATAERGECLLVYPGHGCGAAMVAWSPDGRQIASGGI